MTVADTIAVTRSKPEPLQHLVLSDVSWEFYEHLLEQIGDRPIRVTYFQGALETMSPLPAHEIWKRWIAGFIESIAVERGYSLRRLGSTTFRSRKSRSGLEPDECYYIQSADGMRGKMELSLDKDPPPDLAVEVDITSRSVAREPVYAALKVPELWRFDGTELRFLALRSDKSYEAIGTSLAFPWLKPSDLQPFLQQAPLADDAAVLRSFREWLRSIPKSD